MRWFSFLLLALSPLTVVCGDSPDLLAQAVDRWIGDRDEWAFTQTVREFAGTQVREERRERYDPSRPEGSRWELVAVNGRPPAAAQRAGWEKHKNRHWLRLGRTPGDFVDFARATVLDEAGGMVRYGLPLRPSHRWLYPAERISLRVTVSPATRAVDRLEVRIDEGFPVALGLGSVVNLYFNLRLNPSVLPGEADDPAAARPAGVARAVLRRLGERVEYDWSDFRRVPPFSAARPPPGPVGAPVADGKEN